jgi:hypothetical protein
MPADLTRPPAQGLSSIRSRTERRRAPLAEARQNRRYERAPVYGSGAFKVGPDETVNCTVTNDADPGTVTVTKGRDGTVPGHARTDVTQSTSGDFNVAPEQTLECTVTNVRDPNPPPPEPGSDGGSGTGGGTTGGPGPARLVGRPSALAFTGSGILVRLTFAALALLGVGAGLLILRQRLRRA